jgi:hypothetical protein
VEDEPVHVAGEVGQRHLGRGTGHADGADDEAHRALLPGLPFSSGSPPFDSRFS